MIDFKIHFEKHALKKGVQEKTLLCKLKGVSDLMVKSERKPLNISIVLDISGSMNGYISSFVPQIAPLVQPANNPQDINKILDKDWITRGFGQYQNNQIGNVFAAHAARKTKLDLVKKAAISLVSKLNENDLVSIVVFGDVARVVQEAVNVTASAKQSLIQSISSISIDGNTNLYDGWIKGVTEIAKKQDNKYINRAILLTDGEVNKGVMKTEEIIKDVVSVYEKGISVSTFGVGDNFNEVLLQKIANNGGGNSYYIDDENKFEEMFANEISGLSNIVAENLQLELVLNDGSELVSDLNKFETKDGQYLLTNLINSQEINALFKLKVQIKGKVSEYKIGTVKLTYKDQQGNNQTFSIEISLPVMSNKEWEKQALNEEVKVQEVLNVVANNKLVASERIANGDIGGATEILRGSSLFAMAASQDDRILSEVNSLQDTIDKSAVVSAQAFRKDLMYQSYSTRTGKMNN